MMNIKNYVVKVENVDIERQGNMINYLFNETHSNHKNTKIISDKDKDNYNLYLTELRHLNEKNYIVNRKGGKKLKRIAKSFTFNPPKSFNCSEEELKQITMKMHEALNGYFQAKGIMLSHKDCLSVCHIQKNSHIHTIIPMVDRGGNNVRDFNSKDFLLQMKIAFTKSVDLVLQKSIVKYEREETFEERIIKQLTTIRDEFFKILQRAKDERTQKYFKNQIIVVDRMIKSTKEVKAIDKLQIEELNTKIEKINRTNKTGLKPIKF